MCGGGTSDGTVVNGGFRQGTDNAGDGGKILIVSEYAVTEKDDVIIGQIGVGSRGIKGCLHQVSTVSDWSYQHLYHGIARCRSIPAA